MHAPPAVYAEPVFSKEGTRSLGRNLTGEINIIDLYTQPIEADNSIGIISQITKFKNLKDNWDGYGAVPPSNSAIENANSFIGLLPEIFVKKLNKEDITPSPYGTILLEWFVGEDSLTAEIGDSKIGFVSDINNSPEIILDGELFDGEELPAKVIQELFKLY